MQILGAGTGNGTVTGPGINCAITAGVTTSAPGTCAKHFSVSTPQTRTYAATPAFDHTFAGWSGACSGTNPTCSITGSGTATAKFDAPGATPPAPPTNPAPPADPGAGGGSPPGAGQGGGEQAGNNVDAEIVDTWFKRSRRGLRLLKVEMLAGEPVHVLLSLERRGRQLVAKSKHLKAGEHVLTLVVAKGVKKGGATLVASLDDGGSVLDLSKSLRLPRA